MGEVFEARDTSLDRPVALKFLPLEDWEDEGKRRRLLREARLAASLNDPGICTIFEVSENEGIPYVAMELVEGRPLGETELDWNSFQHIFLAALNSLRVAHGKGIVHRDLKPTNILLSHENQPKILDFGLARSTLPQDQVGSRAATVARSHLAGTPAYMSPEQVRGEPVDARSDLFSVGVMMHELITGSRPFEGASLMETAAAILKDEPPSFDSTSFPVPDGMEKLIGKALAKQPSDRFQSSDELSQALEQLNRAAPKVGQNLPRWVPWLATGLIFVLSLLFLPFWEQAAEAPPSRSVILVEQARPLVLGFSSASNQLSIDLLEESIGLDPESSEAHSLLGLARLKRFWWYRSETTLLLEALESARQALTLDPASTRGRAVQAIARSLNSSDPGAFLELQECLLQDPRQPEALVWLAYGFYGPAGFFQQAEQLASELEPEGPYRHMLEAWILIQKNDMAAALPIIQQLQLSFPDSDVSPHLQARAAIQAGNLALLSSAIRLYELIAPDKPTARVFRIYLEAAQSGTLPDLDPPAIEEIRLVGDMSMLMAQVYARLGRVEETLQWLRASMDAGSNELVTLSHRDFDTLRPEPRFQAIKRDLEERVQALAAELDR